MTIAVVSNGIQGLMDLVYTHTNRPDLVTETRAMVKKAVMKLHCLDGNFWKQDLRESTVLLPAQSTSRYQIDASDGAILPLFRKAEYVRTINGTELEYVDANNILDGYSMERYNYFTQIGMALNLVSSTLLSAVTVGYYAYPNITEANFSSWIATQFPDAVAEEAARNVFKMIGKDEEHARYENLTHENEKMILAMGI